MSKGKDSLLMKLREFGEDFMRRFEDYQENSDDSSSIRHVKPEEDDNNNKADLERNETSNNNIIEFKIEDNHSDLNSIRGRSLDKTEKEIGKTITEQKKLRKKVQMERVQQQKIESQRRKEAIQDPRLRIENSKIIQKKSEQQLELDKLSFEIKDFVKKHELMANNNSMTLQAYQEFLKNELEAQGKSVSSKSGNNVMKKNINHNEMTKSSSIEGNKRVLNFKEEFKKEKKERNQRKIEGINTGMFDKKKERRDKILKAKQGNLRYQKFLLRNGCPSDIGHFIYRGKKTKIGSIGNWKNGNLEVSKREFAMLSQKRKLT